MDTSEKLMESGKLSLYVDLVILLLSNSFFFIKEIVASLICDISTTLIPDFVLGNWVISSMPSLWSCPMLS